MTAGDQSHQWWTMPQSHWCGNYIEDLPAIVKILWAILSVKYFMNVIVKPMKDGYSVFALSKKELERFSPKNIIDTYSKIFHCISFFPIMPFFVLILTVSKWDMTFMVGGLTFYASALFYSDMYSFMLWWQDIFLPYIDAYMLYCLIPLIIVALLKYKSNVIETCTYPHTWNPRGNIGAWKIATLIDPALVVAQNLEKFSVVLFEGVTI